MYYVFGHNDLDGELEQVSIAFSEYVNALNFKQRQEKLWKDTCFYIFKDVTDGE